MTWRPWERRSWQSAAWRSCFPRIRFVFTASKDTLWCEKDYEVCFDQVTLPGAKAKKIKNVTEAAFKENSGQEAPGEVKVTEEGFAAIIRAGKLRYVFDKRGGAFTSIKLGQKELLEKPMTFNFFRAPVDNDTMRGDWYRAHLNDYDVKVYDVKIRKKESQVQIVVEQSFGWSMYQPFFKATTKYVIDGSGKLNVICDGETSNKVTFLPRFGIRLFLPKSFDTFTYYGFGPNEAYVDKHQSSYLGCFTSKVADAFEDYIRPQENSSHCGCRYATIFGKGVAMTFTAEKDFSLNVSEYTQEELAGKRHHFELEKCGSTVACVDAMMAGVGSNSCGPALAEQFCIPLPKLHLNLSMEIYKTNCS